MTSIEKMIIAVMGVFLLALFVSVKSCNSAISNAGGLRAVIVEAGKEAKSISKEINND